MRKKNKNRALSVTRSITKVIICISQRQNLILQGQSTLFTLSLFFVFSLFDLLFLTLTASQRSPCVTRNTCISA